MKINSVRGVLLLAGVALLVAKIAGLIAWPWLAVLVPLIGWGYPYIAGFAGLVAHLVLGILMMGFIVVMGIAGALDDRKVRLQRRRDIAEGRVVAGIWDQ